MTPMLATPTPTPALDYTAIAKRHKDGSVLLSVSGDLMCKLNGMGALTWIIIEERAHDWTVADLVQRLSERLEAINREGVLFYEVSSEQLHRDTVRLLERMVGMGLLYVATDPRGSMVYRIPDGVTATTSAPDVLAPEEAAPPPPSPQPPSSFQQLATASSAPASASSTVISVEMPSTDTAIKLLKRETMMAFTELAKADAVLKFSGFEALVSKVEEFPTAEPRTTDREICRRVRAMVDRAQIYYPKKAMCLQHSSVVSCLLRQRGVPAEMVMGAQEFSGEGHAWVEVEGEVVNDSPTVKTKYRELRRV